MNLSLPAGFEPPPDTEIGGEFEAVATFQLNEDGTLSLLKIDGSEVEAPEEEKAEVVEEETVEESPMPADAAGNMMNRYASMMKGK